MKSITLANTLVQGPPNDAPDAPWFVDGVAYVDETTAHGARWVAYYTTRGATVADAASVPSTYTDAVATMKNPPLGIFVRRPQLPIQDVNDPGKVSYYR
jgi:hypothetical protein